MRLLSYARGLRPFCWLALMLSMLSGRAAQRLMVPGTVVEWGNMIMPYVEPGTRFTNLAAGANHNLAIRSDGTVVAWGRNDWGQSAVPQDLKEVVAIAAGGDHNLALTSAGAIIPWGSDNGSGQNNVPPGLSNVLAVAAGALHSIALANGRAVAWGAS